MALADLAFRTMRALNYDYRPDWLPGERLDGGRYRVDCNDIAPIVELTPGVVASQLKSSLGATSLVGHLLILPPSLDAAKTLAVAVTYIANWVRVWKFCDSLSYTPLDKLFEKERLTYDEWVKKGVGFSVREGRLYHVSGMHSYMSATEFRRHMQDCAIVHYERGWYEYRSPYRIAPR